MYCVEINCFDDLQHIIYSSTIAKVLNIGNTHHTELIFMFTVSMQTE